MITPKEDLGYDTFKIPLSTGTVTGLFDTDGSYRIRIRTVDIVTKRYGLEISFTQIAENNDVVYCLKNNFGIGNIYRIPAKGNRKAKDQLVINFLTLERKILCENWLDCFPPLTAGKRRDYLILKQLLDHQLNKYKSFDEFRTNKDLKARNIFIGISEIDSLSPTEKRKSGAIACLYLKSKSTPEINRPLIERKKTREILTRDIYGLAPLNTTLSIGLRLGKYFLLGINKEVKEVEKSLLDETNVLPDDYLVGLFIGDGSLELSLDFKPNIDYGFKFTLTLSQDSRTTLVAVKNKLGGRGQIRKLTPGGTVFQYYLESTVALKDYVLPLLNQFPMTYSKQMQFNILKEAMVITETQQYKTEEGMRQLVYLWWKINQFHKKPRRTSYEEMLRRGYKYFVRMNRT